MSLSFLDRGRGAPTVQMAAPQGADMGNSTALAPRMGTYDAAGDAYIALQGRASLTLLSLLIVGAVVFYMWTRDAQGS